MSSGVVVVDWYLEQGSAVNQKDKKTTQDLLVSISDNYQISDASSATLEVWPPVSQTLRPLPRSRFAKEYVDRPVVDYDGEIAKYRIVRTNHKRTPKG